jgi:RNA polymerase sigma-70 factor (ECF subfamily)
MLSSFHEVTRLLEAWNLGDRQALDQLIPLVYEELRRQAHRYILRENPAHLLQTTALVHEAYIRLAGARAAGWENRAHFFAICAGLMRQILVDFARSARSEKRGGQTITVPLLEEVVGAEGPGLDVLAVDEALQEFAVLDSRKAKMIELRFFGGLSVEETALVLNISRETVLRDWRLAKAWLLKQLGGKGEHSKPTRHRSDVNGELPANESPISNGE